MKNPILPLFFLATFFLFTSCEKETLAPADSTFHESTFSLSKVKETVIFHYSQYDISTQERSGFIIDKYNKVKAYTMSVEEAFKLPKGNSQWTRDDVNYLYSKATNTVIELDESTLEEYYHKISSVTNGDLSEITSDNSENSIQSFYAFKAKTQIDPDSDYSCQSGGCGSGSAQSTITTFTPRLLLSEGAQHQINPNDNAGVIVDWMKELIVDAGL